MFRYVRQIHHYHQLLIQMRAAQTAREAVARGALAPPYVRPMLARWARPRL